MFILTACSGTEEVAPPSPPTTEATTTAPATTAITTTTTATTAPEVVEVVRMPLTGTPLDEEAQIPQRPALAVKLDNHPRARPQAGLNEADVVFEENVESLTRFAAVFHSQDSDPVGPIRSGRSQDVGILSGLNNPLFAWSGGNAGVRQLIRNSDLVDLDAGFTPGYYRRSGRGGSPHNLYSSTEALWANTPENWKLPPRIFTYLDVDEAPEGEIANLIRVPMDGVRVRWEFDENTNTYLRFQNDGRHDTETGQVSTDNVIVMAVTYQSSSIDRSSPEAQLVGSGPVAVFSRGLVRTGTWERESINDVYAFVADDGEPIGLIAGRSFVLLARAGDQFVTWE
jgi:hypothetical protein